MTRIDSLQLVDYIPEWPSYHTRLLAEAYIHAPDGRTWALADHNLIAYRVQTRYHGQHASMIVPVPTDLDDPLNDPRVIDTIANTISTLR